MKGTWAYQIVSNYRRIISAFFAAAFLFLGTEAAADPIRSPADLIRPPVVIHPCLPKIREARKPPIPLPGPQPLPIGCLIPGCDLAVAGPLELLIELSGDFMPSAQLEIDGLSRDQISMLQHSGESRTVSDQQTTFKLERGRTLVSGLRVDLGTRMRTEELVTALLGQIAAPIIPTVRVSLLIDAKETKKWVTKNGKMIAQDAGPKIAINLKVIQGKTTVNESSTEYEFIPCEKHPVLPVFPLDPLAIAISDGFPPDDWIRVTKQVGGAPVNLGQNAVALVNGLTQNGSSPLWVGPEAYKANTFLPMRGSSLVQPEDRIETSSDCANDENKCAEVSVFAEGLGMTFSTLPKENPSKDWETGLGEIVEIPIAQNGALPNGPLVVPVEFYILWEHANDSQQNPNVSAASCPGMSPTTDCLADWWLLEANTLWGNMWSGIQFTKRIPVTVSNDLTSYASAACDSRTSVDPHFGLQIDDMHETAVRVFFVRISTDNTIVDINGNPTSALAWTCTGAPPDLTQDNDYYNNIFISTATANSTTLAHELGHALYLFDANDLDCPSSDPLICVQPYAKDSNNHYPPLSYSNLMWSGSPMSRNSIAKGQAYRGNVNSLSAVHRLRLSNRPLTGHQSDCLDWDSTNICPALYVDK